MPGSQVDLRPVRNLDNFIDQEFDFKIIKFNQRRGNIVLSRRVLLEERKEQKPGRQRFNRPDRRGAAKNRSDHGAFIDLAASTGCSTSPTCPAVSHPSELFQVGDKVQVKVLKSTARASA